MAGDLADDVRVSKAGLRGAHGVTSHEDVGGGVRVDKALQRGQESLRKLEVPPVEALVNKAASAVGVGVGLVSRLDEITVLDPPLKVDGAAKGDHDLVGLGQVGDVALGVVASVDGGGDVGGGGELGAGIAVPVFDGLHIAVGNLAEVDALDGAVKAEGRSGGDDQQQSN